MIPVSVSDLAALLGAEVVGDGSLLISRISTLESADRNAISFLANSKYREQLAQTQAACVLIGQLDASAARHLPSSLICADPYLAYARLTQWWRHKERSQPKPGVHPSAVIAASAYIHPSASVGPLVVVGEYAHIEAGVVLHAHSSVGDGARIGEETLFHSRAVVAAACQIGRRAIVHSGAVIGADGFGFAPTEEGHWAKIEQLGGVRVGDDVEIGANTCIDRGALDDTVLGNGVKLDNLVQIGHNVRVGDHTAMAGCVGIAGSARIGAHCTLGGGAIVLGHLQIVDHVHISAATVISKSLLKPGHYSGVFPADSHAQWEKNAATLKQLHALRERLRHLEASST